MKHKIFEIGGCVRDELLGLHTKDIDFTVVIDQQDEKLSVDEGWAFMKHFLLGEGFKIFLETKDCFTIRAMFPKEHQHEGLVADFVMARKEVGYIPGTRKPILEQGEIIDLFNGQQHLKGKLLMTPLDPMTTLMDDPLRLLRALRFSITKGFTIDEVVWNAMFQPNIMDKLENVVSQERIREEVTKMMKYDTLSSLRLFQEIDKREPKLLEIIFGGNMWLLPSTKK
jgi:tRNA nucleotidyltransferase/poly(A) polymerase